MSDFEVVKKIFGNFILNNGKKIFYTIIFSGIIMSIFDMITPFFYKELISTIEDFLKTNILDKKLIINIFIVWGVFIIISTIFNAFVRYLVEKANLKNYTFNHIKYSNKIFNMQYNEYLNEKSGSLFKKYDRGQEDSYELITIFFSEILISISSILIISVTLFIIDVRMAFATLSMIPLMIVVGTFFNLKTNKLQDKINDLWDKSYGIIGDGASNLGLLKTLSIEKVFAKLFKKEIEIADREQRKIYYRWVFADVYANLLIMISRFFVMGLGIYLITIGKLDFATLFLFFAFVGHIYFPLAGIFRRLQMIQRKLKGIKKFYEKFDDLEQDISNKSSIQIGKINGDIEFNNVSFSYNLDKEVFKKLSFKINPGEKIAFVGNTGAGKSTIVNLLFRFWDIDSGEILIDKKSINKISKESLRKSIGLVMQDNTLFNMTIKENLLFANSHASLKDIKQALKNAEAHFVFDLKDGINTIIGERGLKLSGGEKQRLSIARLFLKNPKILILDEATSALDNKTEKLVQKALDKLMKGRTSIVIAHRLSTIKNADKIFMLENGKIVEEGNYPELMDKKSKFYNLANPEHLIIN